MWYEVIPVMLICGGAVVLPQVCQHILNSYIMDGNPMRRDLEKDWDKQMVTRDSRLSEKLWKFAGLEAIPGE